MEKAINMIYFWETEKDSGLIFAQNDEEAIKKFRKYESKLLCLYKQSNTKDGTPFQIVWEQIKKN